MTDKRKLQIEAEVTADTSGLEQITQAAQEMGQVVQAAGQQATQGVAAVGNATQELSRRQSALLQQIERTAIKTTEGNAAWLAHRAAIEGVTAQAAPFLARLREIEAGQHNVAMSAQATAAALRGIPAQFTDIATSLASGQRPMQVLLQQGGQLKDMFGGIGPAARALGGYVAGLINPFTLGAAAIAAVAIGAHQGAEEMRAFQNAVALTGNAIGLSLSQFVKLRDSIEGIAGTRGKAAEVLTAIASNAELSSRNIRGIAEAALLMERATGQSVQKTVADFAKLAEAPVTAAQELNRQYNFLTAAIFATIRALDEQGKKQEASEVAIKALADTTRDRAAAMVDNVGVLEKAWRGVLGVLKQVGDNLLDIGRQQTTAQQLASVRGEIASASGQDKNRPFRLPWEPSLDDLRQREANLQEMLRLEQRGAETAAQRSAAERAGVAAVDALSKANDQYASKQEKLNKALRDYRKELDDIRAIPASERSAAMQALLDPGTIRRTEAGIRDSFRETGGESDVAAVRARQRVLAEENRRRLQALSSLDFSQPLNLTDSEKKVIEIEEKLKTSLDAVTRAREQKALQTARDTIESDKNRAAQDKQIEGAKKALETITKQAEAAGQQADAIEQQARSQEAANATFGKSATAIQEMVLAQLKLQAAEADSSDTFDPRYVAGLQKKVEAQQRYVDALKASEAQQIRGRQTEEGRAQQEDAQTLQLEVSLLGRSRQERDLIIAQRRVEVDLAKELASIDRSGASDVDKEELRAKARANAAVKAQNAANKVTLDEWQKTADSIENSLTDALLRGFESGKGFASNFRDTLKNMFATLVLKPVIQAIMQPVSGAITGIAQGIGQQVVGGGGSALGSAGSILGAVGGLGSIGTAFTAGSTSVGVMAGSIAGGGGLMGGVASALGAMGPIGWVALAAGAAAMLLGGKGGGPKTESGFGLDVPLRGDPTAARTIAEGIQNTYRSIAGQLAKDLQVGIFSATDPKGTAQTQLAVQAALAGSGIYSRAGRLGGIENVGRSDAELQAAITEESNRVILHALQATHLPDKIGAYLRQLGDVDALSGGALQAAVQKVQAAMTQRQSLEDRLFDLTHTELERSAEARRKEREALDETNRALYDHVAALSDLRAAEASARDNLLSAYQSQSDALRGVIERQQGYAQQLRELRDSLSLTGSAFTASQRQVFARSRFEGTLSSAIAGNDQALQGLGGSANDFLAAARQAAHTPIEVATALAKVQAGLTTAAAASEGRATVAQQQLDTLTEQLTALGLLNTSVLSVGDAMTAYLAAQTQIQQETLRYTTQMAADQAVSDAAIQTAAAAVAATAPPVSAAESRAAQITAMIAANVAASVGNQAAVGGYRAGSTLVGELGPEVVDFETPGRVYTADQTRGMFANHAELAPLLRQVAQLLQAGNADRRREAAAIIAPLVGINSTQKKWDRVGIPLGEDMLAGAA